MATLNEQLGALYESKWPALKEQMAAKSMDRQPPFMLGIGLETDKGYTNEDWYASADLKIMVFGRETNVWRWPTDDNGHPLENVLVDDFMESYERFFSDYYKEDKVEGPRFLGTRSQFFNGGVNGIMDGIQLILNAEYPEKRAAYLWNNISKFSTIDGNRVSSDVHQMEYEQFHVIPEEIKILNPDIIIFFTGFGKNGGIYDPYIRENFNIKNEATLIQDGVVKFDIENIPLAYKTCHPQGLDATLKWEHYGAILADIKANLETILSH